MFSTSAFADDYQIKQNTNKWGTLLQGRLPSVSVTDIKSMTVNLQSKPNGIYYSEGSQFVLKRNGDTEKPVKGVGNNYPVYDVTGWSTNDDISLALTGGIKPKDVHAGYFEFSTRTAAYNDSTGFQGRALFSWYDSTTEEMRNGFFKEKLLGEVEIREIPIVMLKNLVDGGILSIALITFAILLGVGLVVRYLHSLRSLR